MACDCKANRAIVALGKRYGTTSSATRKDIIGSWLWKGVQYVFLGLVAILTSPILFMIVAFRANVKKDTVIHLDKIVGLNRK